MLINWANIRAIRKNWHIGGRKGFAPAANHISEFFPSYADPSLRFVVKLAISNLVRANFFVDREQVRNDAHVVEVVCCHLLSKIFIKFLDFVTVFGHDNAALQFQRRR